MMLRHTMSMNSTLSKRDALKNLVALAGWQDAAGMPALPLTPGGRELRVRIRENQFRIVVRHAMRLNAFAPICEGTVIDTTDGRSMVSVHFRLSWSTLVFLLFWFGLLGWMIWQSTEHQLRVTNFLEPTTQIVALVLVEFLFMAPIAGIVALLINVGFSAEHSQEIMNEAIQRAIRPLASAPTLRANQSSQNM